MALPEGVDVAEAAQIVTETGYPAEPLPSRGGVRQLLCVEESHVLLFSNKAQEECNDEPAAEAELAVPADGDGVGGDRDLASCVNSIEKA